MFVGTETFYTGEQLAELDGNIVHILGDESEYWMYQRLSEFFHGLGNEDKDGLIF